MEDNFLSRNWTETKESQIKFRELNLHVCIVPSKKNMLNERLGQCQFLKKHSPL
jgi:hypothetical protein